MGRVSTTRHDIDFGEGIRWTPPAGTGAFFVWSKVASDDAAMRWRRLAGWDVATASAVSIADVPTGVGVQLTAAEVTMDWPGLLALFDGYDNEILQVTSHDGGATTALRTRDVFLLPPPASTNAASIAALERRFLKQLLEMRAGLGDLVGGHVKVRTADGTEVERIPIAVIDRRVAEVRARIAWFEAAARGNGLPRAEFW